MKRIVTWALFSALACMPALAQEPGPVAKIYLVKVKPGMEAQFEEAYKQHVEWHRQQNDSWVWDAWQYQSGERFGQYVVVTSGHHWKDFDERGEMEKADNADAQKRLLPLTESVTVWWSRAMPDLSRLPQGEFEVRVARVTDYHIKPGKGFEFVELIRKAGNALAKANWGDPILWTQDLTGQGGVFSAVEMLPNWSALAPSDKSIGEVLASQLGQETASHMRETFWNCVARTETHLVAYRPDLSYAPSSQ